MSELVLVYKKHGRPDITGANNPRSRKVNALDMNGNYLKSFYCIMDAIRELFPNEKDYKKLKQKGSNICNCCRGSKPNAYGYKWEYADNKKEVIDNE